MRGGVDVGRCVHEERPQDLHAQGRERAARAWNTSPVACSGRRGIVHSISGVRKSKGKELTESPSVRVLWELPHLILLIVL